MAILYAGEELHAVIAELLVEIVNEHGAVFCREMASMVIKYLPVGKSDDIAAYGHIVGSHLISDAGSLKRTSTLIYLVEVVAQYGGVCHLAAWAVSVGDGDESAASPFLCQQVHIWCVGVLKKGLSSQSVNGMVGHAVSKNYQVFHYCSLVVGYRHDVGKDAGSCHSCSCSVALNEHWIFLVAFGSEQHYVV